MKYYLFSKILSDEFFPTYSGWMSISAHQVISADQVFSGVEIRYVGISNSVKKDLNWRIIVFTFQQEWFVENSLNKAVWGQR